MFLGLPVEAIIQFFSADDSFYYYQIAQNFAGGKFSTFDGVNQTNGYHPLWGWLLTPIFFFISSPETGLYAAKLFEVIIVGVAGALFISGAAIHGWNPLAATIVPVFLLGQRGMLNGLEAATYALILSLLYFGSGYRISTAKNAARRRYVFFIAAIALIPWARLEGIAVGLFLATVIPFLSLWSYNRPRNLGVVLFPSLVALVGFGVYLIAGYIIFDMPVPVSGWIKQNVYSFRKWGADGRDNFFVNFLLIGKNPQYYLGFFLTLPPAALLVYGLIRKGREYLASPEAGTDVFLLALGAAHMAKWVHSATGLHPIYTDASWYFVPLYFLEASIAPYLFVRLRPFRFLRSESLVSSIVLVGVVAALAYFGLDEHDKRTRRSLPSWGVLSWHGSEMMSDGLPADAVVGSTDSGVFGYFSNIRVVNLDGLVNSAEYARKLQGGDIDDWMAASGITHLANVLPKGSNDCSTMGNRTQRRTFRGECKFLYQGPRLDGHRRFLLWAYSPGTLSQEKNYEMDFFTTIFASPPITQLGDVSAYRKGRWFGLTRPCPKGVPTESISLYLKAKRPRSYGYLGKWHDWENLGGLAGQTCYATIPLPPVYHNLGRIELLYKAEDGAEYSYVVQ